MKVATAQKVAAATRTDAPPGRLTLPETREALGLMIDSANNYLTYRTLSMPPRLKIDALGLGLQDLRDRIRRLYDDLGGADVWEEP